MFYGQYRCLFFMERFDLGLYCWQYRLPKNISCREEQTIKVMTDRVYAFGSKGRH